MRLPAFLGSLAFTILSTGCGSTVIDDDHPDPDDNDPSCPASEPASAQACSEAALECSYSHEPDEECTFTHRCDGGSWVPVGSFGGGCEQCRGYPSCAAGEDEVPSCDGLGELDCHAQSLCGSTIFCASPSCGIAPACDPGDVQVDGECPPTDGSCYAAEACGASVNCRDSALPQHGCPGGEPAAGEDCDGLAASCDYDTGNGCYSSYACDADAWSWVWVGGGCDGDP